jgi:two-component system, NarL family, invasion response regulator UvrY
MGSKCRCLIVDDHPIVRKGISDLLLENGVCDRIVEIDSGATALAAVCSEPWDLLILDVALPDKHGLEVLKEVKLLRPKLPILMLSLYPEREFALRAFRAGASGYLTKDRPPSELLSAVNDILAGRRYLTGALADQMASFISGGQPMTPHAALSDREMEVLRLLGQGLSPSSIASHMALSVKTISTYRARILEKLALRTTGDLVRYAIEHHLTA